MGKELLMNTHNMQNRETPDKRIYTVNEIAIILNISRSSAYELIKQELFRSVKIGANIRISKNSFDYWLDSQNN
jgi:excisionase family DNA binding protein